MPTLNVGVVDLPHGDDDLTTGDLAEILEAKYDLFRGFVEDNLDKIADQMADALDGALNNMLNGAAVPENPYAEAMEWVGARFREFINSGEVERLGLIGVPTEAALKGVNHRLKIKRGGRRQSFVDTGLLVASFIAWMDFDGKDYGQGPQANTAQGKTIEGIQNDLKAAD